MKCIGYNTHCIGAVLIRLRDGTNTVGNVTNILRKVTLTKSYRNTDNIVKNTQLTERVNMASSHTK